jgi:filamentous hemagglutinin
VAELGAVTLGRTWAGVRGNIDRLSPNVNINPFAPELSIGGANTSVANGFVPFRSKLGLDFESSLIHTPNGSSISISSRQIVLEDGAIVLQKGGAPASEFRGTFNSETGNLKVDWMGATQQGNGLGTEMMSRAIEKIGPSNIKSISGQLDELNKSIFNEYYHEIGYDVTQSIARTPAGKIRQSLGYGDLQYSNGILTGYEK